ncbi:glycosyltransferase family A protein [Hymenobacter sp. YC55]|uniref:glycosyltransferase family 2 protein n=1 Tax=Hymenobacter sp. YC55 TaxID=3034019 RepID=UPI0023F94B33|nr:glycosyltransferase family A protein [Hymenobacter sp. YC55]MDF7810199.1 glycosyltransferase family A protein [Hymenobacter sp. YC55]
MSVPFFSVIIPTYNRASFIADTLRSVLAQTFAAFEIIVVDDGSKDNTAEVVQQFTQPSVQYHFKENGERGVARNYGFARAQGAYVLFLDSDDVLHPNHLATLHAAIQQQNQPNFIATKFDFNRNGQRSASDLALLPAGSYSLEFFLKGNALACNICVRRQNPALKLFEEDRSFAAVEDWMFMLENMQADTVYLVDAVTLTMNDHDARSMRADNQGLIKRWLKLMQWVAVHLSLTPAQNKQLEGHIFYLCAIHAYADNHRQQAVGFLRQAWPHLPLRKALLLAVRIVAGPQLIGLLKGPRA